MISEVLIETPLGPMKLAAMSMESLSVAPGGKVNISGGHVTWCWRCWLALVGTGWHWLALVFKANFGFYAVFGIPVTMRIHGD